MAVGRLTIRLAVLRAVALPHAPPRLHPQGDAAVAQGRAGRRLRVRHAGRFAVAAEPVLRTEQPALGPRTGGPQRTTLAAPAGGAAPDLPRGRGRRRVRPPG